MQCDQFSFGPIGTFHGAARYRYDAARQAAVAAESGGRVELCEGRNFEQALQGLEGFSRIWLVYVFHHNAQWKPMVLPPRALQKVGVFATRAPYRPNAIGLSCVELLEVRGRTLELGANDLLDGTPILDIKPYLPYADSFPGAAMGWLEQVNMVQWVLQFQPEAEAALHWLEARGAPAIRGFILQQLSENPFDHKRKRIARVGDNAWEIAYRTWRVRYSMEDVQSILVRSLHSGYSEEDLCKPEDPHGDKALHRAFRALQDLVPPS
jgi:tRNA-Thr(GGU) m(6)t(6)A37 methyltransferase TsaA